MCGTHGVPLHFSREGTLQDLIDYLKNDTTKFDAVKDPSLLRITDQGSDKLYMTGFLAKQLAPNLSKKLHQLVNDVLLRTLTLLVFILIPPNCLDFTFLTLSGPQSATLCS